VLLVRELLDGGRWTLPGGWMDAGDSPGGAAAREFHEETGYEVRPLKLAAVYDRTRHGHPGNFFSTVKLFFVCELTGGQPRTSSETGESDFFAEDALPELSLGRVTAQEIRMLFKHFRQPDLPTEFDS
jgi:ADP-ribose pyrophosphatase YjhB (NUDIX family)